VSERDELHAVIGVWFRGPLTWYVKRSLKMENYPGVWSLPSVRIARDEIPDPANIELAVPAFQRMSAERLGGAPIQVHDYLVSGSSAINPMRLQVTLHLYAIDFATAPRLNPAYMTEARWMSAAEYRQASVGQQCGLCLRLWSDQAWLLGLADQPFEVAAQR
jgi:hypothetical protein